MKQSKRVLALVLSLCLLMSLMPAVVLGADAVTTLYVQPNDNWNEAGARFAAYFFGNGDTWVSCTPVEGADGVYEVEVPAGYTSVIFCRMDPDSTTNSWDYKWNQTSDLTIPTDGNNCYIVAPDSWDKGNGQWTTYTPDGGVGETEPTTASPIEYSVAGSPGLCGSTWEAGDINNMMTDEDGDGIYTITYTNVAAGVYEFKVTNGTWYECWGKDGGYDNYILTLDATSDVEIRFDSDTKAITVVINGLEVEEPGTEPSVPGAREYCLVGYIDGADYGCGADYENVGRYVFADGRLTTTFPVDSYIFVKTTDNSKWYMAESYCTDAICTFVEGGIEKMFVPGGVELTFILTENEDGSVTVSYARTSDEPVVIPAFSMKYPSAFVGDPITVSIHYQVDNMQDVVELGLLSYNEKTEAGDIGTADQVFPGHEVDENEYFFSTADIAPEDIDTAFYYVVYAKLIDGTYAYSKVVGYRAQMYVNNCAPHSYANGKCTKCGITDPDYVASYYLVGYINGADYGCNDDYENMGSYKFEDGQLVATFESDSYVFLKTEGNGKWLMTESYCADTTGTFVEGGTEKMFVPGGVELTFTLTENDDGSVTLSYTKASDEPTVIPAVTMRYPTVFVGEPITLGIHYKVDNMQDVVEMGLLSYDEKPEAGDIETADRVFSGYEEGENGYYVSTAFIAPEDIGTYFYYAIYAKLTDGTYVYDKVLGYFAQAYVDACAPHNYVGGKCERCGISDPDYCAPHNYINGWCVRCGISDPDYVVSYYLVGHINGANHGWGTDAGNMGNYKFEDGTLVATFESDSHVFLKTDGKTKWYKAKSYCTNTTCTLVEGGSERMFVPGGVELTFTLTENEDGSVTLSYTKAEAEPPVVPTLSPVYPSVFVGDPITVSIHYEVDNMQDVVEMGLLSYAEKPEAGDIETADQVFSGYEEDESEYCDYFSTAIIAPEDIDTAFYYVIYAKLTDGTYVYSKAVVYRAQAYVDNCAPHIYVDGKCARCGISDPNYVVPDNTYYLVGYINGADYGCNDDYENMGSYKFEDGQLVATFESDSYVFLKTEGNGKWLMTESYCTDTTGTFVVGGTEKMFVPGGVELTFTLTENEDGSVTLSYAKAEAEPPVVPTLYLVYPSVFVGDPITVSIHYEVDNMQDVVEMGLLSYAEKPEAGDIETADQVFSGYEEDESEYCDYFSTAIIAPEDIDTAFYYVIYAKLTDGTYVYSKAVVYRAQAYVDGCAPHIYVDGKCARCGISDPNYVVPDNTYYLVGYINGADYGCNDDYENMGSYKFEDGQLVATFESDSYVFLKTEGNGKWLMTESYCTDTTGTFVVGGTEKMFVPGGVELTFTLTENEDGSVTLSYTKAEVKPSVAPTVTMRYPSVSFEDVIIMNVYYTAENLQDVVQMGLLTYNVKPDAADIGTADFVGSGYDWSEVNGLYYACTGGIAPKDIGDNVYFALYWKLKDGTYGYTKVVGYSPRTYAVNQLSTGSAEMKPLVVAMLNYGAAAQTYFGYNTDHMMNGTLTTAQQAMVAAYSASMIATVSQPDDTKMGTFVNDGTYTKRYPTISFEGAFCINYYYAPSLAVEGDVTMYVWSMEDYEAVDVLTKENATRAVKMELTENGEYTAVIDGIAAKDLDKAVYVSFVYSDGTTEHCGGIIGYTIGAYCKSQAAGTGTLAELTKACAVYGYYAKQLFG